MGLVSDTYWDVGLDFNYKAITLDLRYWGINVASRHTTVCYGRTSAVRRSPAATNLCGNRFVATLKFDTTLSALK